ncbi:MAG: hypothetical protein U5K31_04960 [Balneolaceae bacterium]|nr:hypothetical protein [Balneolaceae bacterium]
MSLYYLFGNLALLILGMVLIYRSSLSPKAKSRGYLVFFAVMVLANWGFLWFFGRVLERM